MTRQRRREQDAEMEKALKINEESYIVGPDKKQPTKSQKEQKKGPIGNLANQGIDSLNQAKSIVKESSELMVNLDIIENPQMEHETVQTSRIPRVSWGLEGRSVANSSVVTVIDSSGCKETPDYEMNRQEIDVTKINKDVNIRQNIPTPPVMVEPTLRDVLMAVQACNNSLLSLTNQMSELKGDIATMRHENQKICERTTAVETRVGELEDSIPIIKKDIHLIKTQIRDQTQRMEGMENRQRRNNVRILGLPEQEEGQSPVIFFEKWLLDIFGVEGFSKTFAIERAHRITSRAPSAGGRPRPIIIRLLNCQDRDNILSKARQRGSTEYKGNKVSFYPDFSVEVQKQRAKFTEVKWRLFALKIKYAMLFPAKLRITDQDGAQFFDTPDAVNTWLDRRQE